MTDQKRKRTRRAEGSITEKNGKFYAVRTLGRDSKGKQVREWSKGFDEKRLAERALLDSLIIGRQQKRTRLTVGIVVDRYVKDVEARGKAATTVQRYKGLSRNIETIKAKQIETLAAADIEGLYKLLRDEGLSNTTVCHVHSLLTASTKWAKRKVLITTNPFEHLSIDAPQREASNVRAMSIEDARNLMLNVKRTRYANAIVLALATGMRRGEVAGLRWVNVDIERRIVLVRESRFEVTGLQGQKRPKSERQREIPLSSQAIEALLDERKRQKLEKKTAGKLWHDEGFVFSDSLGNPIAPISLTYAFRHISEAAGLGGQYSLHSLRHTAATWMIGDGTDIRTVQAILGHSEAGTTLRIYSHVVSGLAAEAVEKIQSRLKVPQK
jgi:integrase